MTSTKSSAGESRGKTAGGNGNQPDTLWEFIPIQDFRRPSEPASEAARSKLTYAWRRLRSIREEATPTRIDAELHSIPQQLLDAVAPPPDWQEPGTALARTLKSWMSSDPPEPAVKAVVGPPGVGVGQILSAFARSEKWMVIDPPAPERILVGSPDSGWEWTRSEQPLVIPSLERWFLRHHRGLGLIRQLLARMAERKKPALLGCDSWAWTFLSHMRGGRVLPGGPLTLKAFDDRALMAWFGGMAERLEYGPVIFRQSDNGKRLLSAGARWATTNPATASPADQEPDEPSDYLKKIAGRSRGIPLVAWSFWRNALEIAAEEADHEKMRQADRKAAEITIWVKPWEGIGQPQIPIELKRIEQFILQALLLHGALSEDALALVLFQRPPEMLQRLYSLTASGLVKKEDGCWRVSLFGYPAVRQYLDDEGFFTDAF